MILTGAPFIHLPRGVTLIVKIMGPETGHQAGSTQGSQRIIEKSPVLPPCAAQGGSEPRKDHQGFVMVVQRKQRWVSHFRQDPTRLGVQTRSTRQSIRAQAE